ncbi:T6SS immunity protein Tli4 family protein [Burkholderia arboris]|uniref:T6SS immunity protein Tli4 family protein n=1 Tax=Burkholderia arboris TaxID=488730 RepID=UPI001CF28996|nr:T6SS immunity protein Tli4 family protein [Burkholderia arboris]MCA8489095.1 hypothetical protein [Burkholderia arboris]
MLKFGGRLFLFAICISAYSVAHSGESSMSNPLWSKLRPWCIGRFVFDRPVASEISNQKYQYRGDVLDARRGVSSGVFREHVSSLETSLKSKMRTDPGGGKAGGHAWLEKVLSPTASSRVFVYQKMSTEGVTFAYDTEGYIYADDVLFHTVGRIGSSALGRVDELYNDTYRRVEARDNWSVPRQTGFCIDNGIITGSSVYTEEVSQSFALMPGRPALLVIQMRNALNSDQKQSLTKTLPELRAQLDRLPGSYRILREGKRTIAGIEAEEVLFAVKAGDITAYRFYLFAPGNPGTLAKPNTSVQLLFGAVRSDMAPEEATSPVDETGALQTWDTLLNSLRLRPGAV